MESTQTIKNQAGDKVGVAVWSGERNENNIRVGWEAYDLSDHFIGKTEIIMQARDLLNGFVPPVGGSFLQPQRVRHLLPNHKVAMLAGRIQRKKA